MDKPINAFKKITQQDIERNILLIDEGKPLDIPLHYLATQFKKVYKKEHPTQNEWYLRHPARNNAHTTACKCADKRYKMEWCLWLLYYLNKEVELKWIQQQQIMGGKTLETANQTKNAYTANTPPHTTKQNNTAPTAEKNIKTE